MSFPTKRLRRLRISEKMRELVQETTLTPKDFICPVFVQEDLKTRIKVESMSEIERLPLEEVNDEVKKIIDLGHRSNFYSPFRDAAECAPKFGDRKTYQVPFTNAREAMMEVETDISEGVDIVMIKPALAYLDLIAETRRKYNVPVAAYSVSGEYALVKAASQLGYVNEKDITLEILHSIKRAGADMIVTYFAKSASRFLQES